MAVEPVLLPLILETSVLHNEAVCMKTTPQHVLAAFGEKNCLITIPDRAGEL